MWTYEQWTGRLSHDGEFAGTGYSGHGKGKNNPELESTPMVGPIPQGWYSIAAPEDTATHGPYVMRLTPAKETVVYGRSGFLIHGDSRRAPGTASEGCIILVPALRVRIWESGDHKLTVVPGQKPAPAKPSTTETQPAS